MTEKSEIVTVTNDNSHWEWALPLRPITVPESILPDLLNVRCLKAVQCLHAVQPKLVERHMSSEDTRKLFEKYRSELNGLERNLYSMADLKHKFVIEDLKTLSQQVNTCYVAKLQESGIDPNRQDCLWQVVEVDWTLQVLHPGDETLHYKVFTKRDIFLESDLFEKTGINIIRGA